MAVHCWGNFNYRPFVADVWVRGAKTTGPIAKSFFFLKSNLFGNSKKFQYSDVLGRNKKFCSAKSRFPVHLPQYKFWIILGPFISWAISMKLSGYYFVHANLQMCQVSLKNIKK
jgi:hypothetical protein